MGGVRRSRYPILFFLAAFAADDSSFYSSPYYARRAGLSRHRPFLTAPLQKKIRLPRETEMAAMGSFDTFAAGFLNDLFGG
ncbi:MAG: hypothetical protein AAFY38_07995 [Pseudomonadota bacterium]